MNTREKAEWLLRGCSDEDLGDFLLNAEDVAQAYLDQQWIPVSERLPEMDVAVIVAQDTGAVFTARWIGCKDWESVNGFFIEIPTHWMPLPPPPEES